MLNIRAELASLSTEKLYRFIDEMETNIMSGKQHYNTDYFDILAEYIDETYICAKLFDEHKKAAYYKEKLSWLRPHNINLIYAAKELELFARLKEVMPEDTAVDLIRLVDLRCEMVAQLQS